MALLKFFNRPHRGNTDLLKPAPVQAFTSEFANEDTRAVLLRRGQTGTQPLPQFVTCHL